MNPELLLPLLLAERQELNRSIAKCKRRLARKIASQPLPVRRTPKLTARVFPMYGDTWLAFQGSDAYEPYLASEEFWRVIGM